jgi:hypothetical protein
MNTGYFVVAKASLIVVIGLAVTGVVVPPRAASLSQVPEKLSRLQVLMTLAGDEMGKLKTGRPVAKLLKGTVDDEVAVFGAAWIDAPVGDYVRTVEDIEQFEKGGHFQKTKRISDPPVQEDFAELNLGDEDIADLKKCRVSRCELKIGKEAIERFHQEIDWSEASADADARALFRQIAFDYVISYERGGNPELAVYRDKHKPIRVEGEFKQIVDEMSPLLRNQPSLRQYLLEYPDAPLSNGTSFMYWQQLQFGLKPTIRINQVVISEEADMTAIASKLLYANHYFRAALDLELLIPDKSRGPGFWLVTQKRLRADGLTGATGTMVRQRIEKDAVDGLTGALWSIRSRLQQER